jgi:uncharacterized protein YjbI with pentapeptide repeats
MSRLIGFTTIDRNSSRSFRVFAVSARRSALIASSSDLSGCDLSGPNLSGSDLSGSDLSGSDLSRSFCMPVRRCYDFGRTIPVARFLSRFGAKRNLRNSLAE